jgi:dephospho-CoA kinase
MKNKIQTKFVAIVGMTGAGKSVVADEFVKAGYGYFRFGQLVLDEVKKRGFRPTDSTAAAEKEIRENFRKQHGPAAMAILNLSKIKRMLGKSDLVGDGMYSWSEYKILKNMFGDRMRVVAVYAPPDVRYGRLEERAKTVKNDPTFRYRSFSPEEAKDRDAAEIENLEKGGPIVMADYLIMNTYSLNKLKQNAQKIIKEIESR